MKPKTFFTFLLLFSIILILGCIGGGSGDVGPQTSQADIQKGNINATLLINGKETTQTSLLGEQTTEIALKYRNAGTRTMNNLQSVVVGCLTPVSVNWDPGSDLGPGQEVYMSWTMQAPEMGQGERITCPVIIRTCYEQTSDGYTEIPVVNEDYRDEFASASTYVRSDVLNIFNDANTFRIINAKGNDNEMLGRIYVSNSGPGWVDYVTYPVGEGLAIYKLKEINLNLTGEGNLRFKSIAGIDASNLESKNWLTNEGKTFSLNAADTSADFDSDNVPESYDYLLKMIGGKELSILYKIGANADDYTGDNELVFERMNYEVTSGYCTDVATVSVILSGN